MGFTLSDFIKLVEEVDVKDAETELDRLEKNPEELDSLANDVDDLEDILDSYDNSELTESLEEHLSMQSRAKKRSTMRRSEPKMARARKLALKRMSSDPKLKSKARKTAINLLKVKLAHKPLNKLSVSEKNRLEDIIRARPNLVNRLATKLVPKIRQIERNRVYKRH